MSSYPSSSGTAFVPQIIAIIERCLQSDLLIKREVVQYLDRLCDVLIVGPCTLASASASAEASAEHFQKAVAISSGSGGHNAGNHRSPHASAAVVLSAVSDVVVGHIGARCKSFCDVFSSLACRHLDPFRRKVQLMSRLRGSTLLSSDELVDVAARATTLELTIAPALLLEYVTIATVVAFSCCDSLVGGPSSAASANVSTLPRVAHEVAAATLSIPGVASTSSLSSSQKSHPFYRVVLQGDSMLALRYRTPPPNSSPTLLSAVYSTIAVWEDHPRLWPLVLDTHRVLERQWLSRLPKTLIVSFSSATVVDVFDSYHTTDVVLVITDVPDAVPPEFQRRITSRGISMSAAATGSPLTQAAGGCRTHKDFRLLLLATGTSDVPPSWAHPATVATFKVSDVDHTLATQVLLDDVYRLAWPQESLRLEEMQAELLEAHHEQIAAEETLWETVVNSLSDGPDAAASVNTARQHWALVKHTAAVVQSELEVAWKRRAEYRIVAEMAAKLFFVWRASSLRRQHVQLAGSSQELLEGTSFLPSPPLSLAAFHEAVVRPAVAQHTTEGSKHFTRCKTSAAQNILAWSNRLCESQLLSANALDNKVPESHNSTSISLHVLKCFVFGKPKDHVFPHAVVEQHRRVVAIWDASVASSATAASGDGHSGADGVIPRAMVDFALEQLPPPTESESEVFARLQRLLLTVMSIKSLLYLEGYHDSLKDFTEWLGHVSMTTQRLPSVETEVLAALVKGLGLLSDPARESTLVDALSLFAVLKELLAVLKTTCQALYVDVPRRKASAMGSLLQSFTVECRRVEEEARQLLKIISSPDGTVNPNRVLEVRTRVAELQEAKLQLIRNDPTGRKGSGLALMRSVDRLVPLCLPPASS